ncbi:MAG TPA: phosphotransferase, partial [Candidatus Baltobacteraceae bacterium]|nr:phosphotransferase [Candidatus Baltobacteraceae bacterium]
MSALGDFLNSTAWKDAALEPITGDASARKYFRLRKGGRTAVLMDASRTPEILPPFVQIALHLRKLGFSAPEIPARDDANGFLLLEDFGDETFSRLLENKSEPEKLFELGTDVLIALHKHPKAVPKDFRSYHSQKMLEDVELFLECHPVPENGKAEFRIAWLEVLPLAHQVP